MVARSEHELRTYQLAGIAAAVATLLNAPFAAALFAIEVVYGDRIIYRKFAYALFAAIIAYVLNSRVLGYRPIFVAPAHAATFTLGEYGVSALVAVAVSAPLALGFGLTMRHTRALADRIPAVARGAAGGLCTAAVALGLAHGLGIDVRHTLGMGDYTIKALLSEPGTNVALGWLLAVAAVGRMLTTGLTIQTGGSAGILIPSISPRDVPVRRSGPASSPRRPRGRRRSTSTRRASGPAPFRATLRAPALRSARGASCP